MSAELRMTYLTPRPCSHVNAHHSARNNIIKFCSANRFTNILKHSYIQVIAAALTYLSTVSPGCHAGVARCSQAGTQNWTIATQLNYHTEQEDRERTHSGFVV